MNWIDTFPADAQPNLDDIAQFVDSPLWGELNTFLQESYDVKPEVAFSGCSAQPGWNVKYRKSGRSLCVLYPMDGFFIALVVIGSKEYDETLEVMPECSRYTQDLFQRTEFSAMGRWLMINVTDQAILDDVKRLIQVRRKVKR